MSYSGGNGLENAPYLISKPSDLANLLYSNTHWVGKYFKQTADIDMNGYTFSTGIGTIATPFKGSYNGGGYSINNLTINGGTSSNMGLFGYVGNDTTTNVFENINLINCNISGNTSCGGLIGLNNSNSEIKNCSVKGQVTASYTPGGLIGRVNTGNIVNGTIVTLFNIGISNCYSTCTIKSTTINTTTAYIGGLIGYVAGQNNTLTIQNCYSASTISGGAIRGGLIGFITAGTTSLTSCYWDKSINTNNAIGGDNSATIDTNTKGLTTDEAKNQTNYLNWDFTNIWLRSNSYNTGYPVLRNQSIIKLINASVSSNKTEICQNEEVTLTATITATPQPDPSIIKYDWYSTNNTSTLIVNGTGNTYSSLSRTLTETTTFYVVASANEYISGQSNNITINVLPPFTPSITVIPNVTEYYTGIHYTFTGNGGTNGKYKWYKDTDTTPVSIADTYSLTLHSLTSYPYDINIRLYGVDSNNCSGSKTKTIQVNQFSISYPYRRYFPIGGPVSVTLTGYEGGSYSVIPESGLNVNSRTGAINLTGAIPGDYTIQYMYTYLDNNNQNQSITVETTFKVSEFPPLANGTQFVFTEDSTYNGNSIASLLNATIDGLTVISVKEYYATNLPVYLLLNNNYTNYKCRLVNGYQLVQQLPLGNTQPQVTKGDGNPVTRLEENLYTGFVYELKLDTTSDFKLVDWGGVLVEVSGNPPYSNIYKIPVNS